ncbi:unnamed protein product [Coffea canephora]|uniref:Carboxypeptidase n=1 Tax=Coffea canephora TaxID=49390 RepID=A0A068TX19_COFCA|nr:unnamed protein product [Coffea canephora]
MEFIIPLHCRNLLKLLLFLTILHHVPHSTTSLDLLPKEALPTKSGYLEVNSTTGSALFYTYYEAQKPTTPLSQIPLLIWLQGGPGCSSMLGNFYELGPWLVTSNVSVKPNPGAWNRIFGVLFIDNPIGTGFSIAASPQEIPRNQHDVAKHLFIAIKKFIKLDDMFKTRPIYVTGESYAGKYVPALGYYILKKNAILPVSNPATQTATYAVNAYYSGFINDKQKKILENLQKKAKLSHVVVLNAGHPVPTDQALNSQAMIEDWVLDRGLFAN